MFHGSPVKKTQPYNPQKVFHGSPVKTTANLPMNPIAKINLGLNVVERRPDGYHNLETIFFPVNINDELNIKVVKEMTEPWSLKVISDTPIDCPPEKNLVIKALMMVKEKYDIPPIKVTLHKMMPSQAGMGGGSSDGAYMIRLLNETFSLGMSIEEMQDIAARLGADCAFFINPVPSYATGIGEKLQPLQFTSSHSEANGIPQLQDKWIALVKPDVAVSTAVAYSHIKPHVPKKNCRDVIMQPIETWRNDLINDFEDAIFPLLPELAEVKENLYRNGAIYAAMSGSGSTIYGIFNQEPSFIKQQYGSIYNTYYQITQ